MRNKARVVAKGNSQHEGINYAKTFAHVACLKAIGFAIICCIQ